MKLIFWLLLGSIPLPTYADIFEDQTHKFGGAADSWKYEEPSLMQDTGFLWGAEYEFKMSPDDFFYYQLNAEFLMGRTRYKGQDLASGTPLEFNQTNFMVMTQGFVGVVYHNENLNTYFIPKIGFLLRAFRDIDDEFAGDYQRDQDYIAIPIGIDAFIRQLPIEGELTLSFWFTAFFEGRNKTYLTDVGGDRDLSFKQDDGSGLQVSGTYTFENYYASLIFRKWEVADSESKPAVLPQISPFPLNFFEPENTTTSIGIRFGLLF